MITNGRERGSLGMTRGARGLSAAIALVGAMSTTCSHFFGAGGKGVLQSPFCAAPVGTGTLEELAGMAAPRERPRLCLCHQEGLNCCVRLHTEPQQGCGARWARPRAPHAGCEHSEGQSVPWDIYGRRHTSSQDLCKRSASHIVHDLPGLSGVFPV